MEVAQEQILNVKKYFKKLVQLINEGASFTFGKKKWIDKKRIDDILCCIEASYPQQYKDYVKAQKGRQLGSNKYYKELIKTIRNKSLFSSNCYSVRYQESIVYITSILNSLDRDMRYIAEEASGMF